VIFVTVGTQLPFDRLITAVDRWAGAAPGREVFAQIGRALFEPRHIKHARFISPEQCSERMAAAEAIVAHAGMGTVLTALELGKPVLVMPRRAEFGEHRNDHQLATARRFAELGKVNVAFDETELPARLDELCREMPQPCVSRSAPDDFVAGLRAFILAQSLRPAASEPASTGAAVGPTLAEALSRSASGGRRRRP
jgi:UDP-N-acetylglucosamine transferase subunit ALG13